MPGGLSGVGGTLHRFSETPVGYSLSNHDVMPAADEQLVEAVALCHLHRVDGIVRCRFVLVERNPTTKLRERGRFVFSKNPCESQRRGLTSKAQKRVHDRATGVALHPLTIASSNA